MEKYGKAQPQIEQELENTAPETQAEECAPTCPERRKFLGGLGGLAAAWACGGLGAGAALAVPTDADAAALAPVTGRLRALKALSLKVQAANDNFRLPLSNHPDNGDELRYPNRLASYSKGLPHDDLGIVDPAAYNAMLRAFATGRQTHFDAIPLGGDRKLVSPQAALAYDLEGTDPHQPFTPAAPAFASAETAGEAVENYWMALCRDVPFEQYGTDPLTLAAVNELRTFPLYADVTPQTLFRRKTAGYDAGPYVSQFLLKAYPFASATIEQLYEAPVAGEDFMTDYAEWLSVQRGETPTRSLSFESSNRYIFNGRAYGEWVHRDFNFTGPLIAALILTTFGPEALDPNNPARTSANQDGFVTFGGPDIFEHVARAAQVALKATWFRKWAINRRLRPEAYCGRVHNHKTGAASYPLRAELLNSEALQRVFAANGTYLLPMAFPEGSPLHPAYTAGHSAFAAAGATICKAFFNEDFVIPDPVKPSADGTLLLPYVVGVDGPPLTVGGELNKLAWGIARARDIAGVHWKSDGVVGNNLGEEMAIRLLQDRRRLYNENYGPLTIRKFDGTVVTV